MAVRYYDDILVAKLKKWIPDERKLRVLKPDETKRLFEVEADTANDKPLKLPLVTLSRNNEIELLLNVKAPKSFDGLRLDSSNPDLSNLKGDEYKEAYNNIPSQTLLFNVIPIKVLYQMDIYTKTYEEGDEYLRNFLFKLINNPKLIIGIPYNNKYVEHTANIRVLSTVSDTSSISERIFPGQFTRWSIQLEIQDAFLFSLPYKNNWRMMIDDEMVEMPGEESSILEVSEKISQEGEKEPLGFNIQKAS